jgi:hypothetical protein
MEKLITELRDLIEAMYAEMQPPEPPRLSLLSTLAENLADKIRLYRMKQERERLSPVGWGNQFIMLPDALEAVGDGPDLPENVPASLKISMNLHHHYMRERLIGAAKRG